jgi:hypothetical protein
LKLTEINFLCGAWDPKDPVIDFLAHNIEFLAVSFNCKSVLGGNVGEFGWPAVEKLTQRL